MRVIRLGKRRTVGLDIGSQLIKCVELEHTSRGPLLVALGIAQVPPQALVEGEIVDRRAVATTIRDLLRSQGIHRREVAIALSGRDAFVKRLTMDRLPPREARQMVRWEAEQHLPFPLSDVSLDFQILDPEGTGPHMEVLLVAAKREFVEARTALVEEAGLTPSCVDVDSFAIQNAFVANYGAGGGVVGLLDVGKEASHLSLLRGGTPLLSRDIPTGTGRFGDILRQRLGIGAEEAESCLLGIFPGGLNAASVESHVRATAEEIAIGIDRARGFLRTGGEGEGIDRLYLSGGGARVPTLREFLAERLGIAVEIASPLQRIEIRDGLLDPLARPAIAPLLMQAVGLALRVP